METEIGTLRNASIRDILSGKVALNYSWASKEEMPPKEVRELSLSDLEGISLSPREGNILPFVMLTDLRRPFREVYERVYEEDGAGRANELLIHFWMREEMGDAPRWFNWQEYEKKSESFGDFNRHAFADRGGGGMPQIPATPQASEAAKVEAKRSKSGNGKG